MLYPREKEYLKNSCDYNSRFLPILQRKSVIIEFKKHHTKKGGNLKDAIISIKK